MVKVYIGKDERYPDFSISTVHGPLDTEVEVNESFLQRCSDAYVEYEAVQDILAELYDAPYKPMDNT